jgi:hypothetical protein
MAASNEMARVASVFREPQAQEATMTSLLFALATTLALTTGTAEAATTYVKASTVQSGIRSGKITKVEANTLSSLSSKIKSTKRKSQRDGKVTRIEKRKLKKLNRNYNATLRTFLRNRAKR